MPQKETAKEKSPPHTAPRMFLIPCSCGTTFAVAEEFDRQGTHIRSFIPCPNCGKRHDPKNRVLRMDYQSERFWKVDGC